MWRFLEWLRSPQSDRKIHGVLSIAFILLIPPSVILWKESIPYLVGISVWANLAGHYSAWQAAKAEDELTKQVQGLTDKVDELLKSRPQEEGHIVLTERMG